MEAFRLGDLHATPTREIFMARIIVTTDPSERPDAPVLLDEFVCPDHLSDDHSAAQIMERLRWAVSDAENAQRTGQPA
jgi:hypothetical protein